MRAQQLHERMGCRYISRERGTPLKLSIVTPLYQSATYIEDLWIALSDAAAEVAGDDYEVIMVNDGSTDNSLSVAVQLAQSEPRLVVVDLSRNFGQHAAIMAGLEEATGERVFIIDSDFDEDPRWIVSFDAAMHKSQSDVVFGVQGRRRGHGLNRWTGELFYRGFRWLANSQMPINQTTARLMSAQYVQVLLRYGESEFFLGGIMNHAGFHQVPHEVEKRSHSSSTYRGRVRLSQAITAVLSFSTKPLFLVFAVGITTCVVTIMLAAILAVEWMVTRSAPSGWTSVAIAILLSTGLIMTSIGIIGVYLSRVFLEVKRRPRSIVRSVFRSSPGCSNAEVSV